MSYNNFNNFVYETISQHGIFHSWHHIGIQKVLDSGVIWNLSFSIEDTQSVAFFTTIYCSFSHLIECELHFGRN